MDKILSPLDVLSLRTLFDTTHPRIVLVGGCFDILHKGHELFLNEARNMGDMLVVLLESDQSVRKRKGEKRPINTQQQRAQQLLTIPAVHYVILLPFPFTDHEYDSLVSSLKPAIIATTVGDPYRFHKERQAKLINAEVVDVIDRLPDYSTTQLINDHE